MNDLKTALIDALPVFEQQVSKSFSLTDMADLTWQHGENTFILGKLVKTDRFFYPEIQLVDLADISDDHKTKIHQRLGTWYEEYLTKHLSCIISLQTVELPEKPKAIAQSIYDHAGLILREAHKEAIKALDKDERQSLGKLGVRIGAYYIYQRDMLKPAAMRLKSILWRLTHNNIDTIYKLPQDGNVSMPVPAESNAEFYQAVALPIFGKACVRVDMIERLNSAIFDGAVEGKYKFDPALASTLGVSVEMIQSILHELGFPFEDKTEGEGEAAKSVRYYTLKKRKTADKPQKPKSDKPAFKKTVTKNRKAAKPAEQPSRPSAPRGYSAFAGLQALKDRQ
jgi:ATP-dependent RNA helicase SUPV3L1/SUV3